MTSTDLLRRSHKDLPSEKLKSWETLLFDTFQSSLLIWLVLAVKDDLASCRAHHTNRTRVDVNCPVRCVVF